MKTCSCGSICNVFVKTCSCGSIRNVFVQDPDLFVQVWHAQLAPVPPTWGAQETQGIQTPGDLSGAGPHDGKQVVNPAAAGGAQVPSGDSPRGALPTLSVRRRPFGRLHRETTTDLTATDCRTAQSECTRNVLLSFQPQMSVTL